MIEGNSADRGGATTETADVLPGGVPLGIGSTPHPPEADGITPDHVRYMQLRCDRVIYQYIL